MSEGGRTVKPFECRHELFLSLIELMVGLLLLPLLRAGHRRLVAVDPRRRTPRCTERGACRRDGGYQWDAQENVSCEGARPRAGQRASNRLQGAFFFNCRRPPWQEAYPPSAVWHRRTWAAVPVQCASCVCSRLERERCEGRLGRPMGRRNSWRAAAPSQLISWPRRRRAGTGTVALPSHAAGTFSCFHLCQARLLARKPCAHAHTCM